MMQLEEVIIWDNVTFVMTTILIVQSPKTPLQKSLGGLGTQLSFYSLIIIGVYMWCVCVHVHSIYFCDWLNAIICTALTMTFYC